MRSRLRAIRVGTLAVALAAPATAEGAHQPARDEQVVMFPTAAWFDAAAGEWVVPLHGWIFEPEKDSAKRKALLGVLRKSLDIEGEESEVFRARARPFLVDDERGKRLGLQVAQHRTVSDESGTEGHFAGQIRLPPDPAAGIPKSPAAPAGAAPWATVSVETKDGDQRRFEGRVQLVPPEGVSVISDVDDTIKITGMGDRREILERTFLRPFEPVPGMAPVYHDLEQRGVVLHYVSAMPWQLYEPLRAMLEEHGFPRGSMHLKTFRWKDRRFFDLIAASDRIKAGVVEELITRYPGRRFVLIGDDSEQDAELYAGVVRQHPGSILGVAIRRSGLPDRPAEPRESLPGVAWLVFSKPEELRAWAPLRDVLATRLDPTPPQ